MATKRPLPNLLRETTKISRQTDRLTWSRYWRGCLGRGAVNMGHRNRVETNYTNQQQVDFNLSLVPLEHVIPHQKPYQYAIPKWAPEKRGKRRTTACWTYHHPTRRPCDSPDDHSFSFRPSDRSGNTRLTHPQTPQSCRQTSRESSASARRRRPPPSPSASRARASSRSTAARSTSSSPPLLDTRQAPTFV